MYDWPSMWYRKGGREDVKHHHDRGQLRAVY